VIWDWGHAAACLPALLDAARITVLATAAGGAIALVGGLAWCAAGQAPLPLLAVPARAAVVLVRSTPLLIQLYLIYYGMPALGFAPDPLVAGIAGLGLHYAAYAAEVWRSGFAAVPAGQAEAARVLGLGPWRRFRHVLLPQALPAALPPLAGLIIALFKETPLLAAITVIELLGRAKLLGAESFRYLEPMTLVGAIFLAVSLAAAGPAAWLERRLRRRPA
jgi:polar amino acid transport system permease protein